MIANRVDEVYFIKIEIAKAVCERFVVCNSSLFTVYIFNGVMHLYYVLKAFVKKIVGNKIRTMPVLLQQ